MAIRLIILFFLVAINANAATYYIDYVDGADTNNGTTTGTAWKHSPGDENATSTSGSATLSAGDIVIFKGGVEYVVGDNSNTDCWIYMNWSGSDGSPITYDGNSAETWGTGKAIITSNNNSNSSCTYRRGFDTHTARSWIVIQSFEFTDIGGYVTNPSATSCSPSSSAGVTGAGIQFYGAGGGNHIIQDNYFHEIGTWEPQDPFEDGAIIGGGIAVADQSDVTIDSNEFTKMSAAVNIYTTGSGTTSDITVSNNLIHNYIRWGIDIPPQGTGATIQNISIFGNKIYDYPEYDQGVWAGCGEWPHTDGIFIRSDYSGVTWTNLRIYNNEFYDTESTGGGTASIYVTEGPDALIYNNTFRNVLHASNIFLNNTVGWGFTGQDVGIYNNSFYGKNSFIRMAGSTLSEGDIEIQNNIFHHTGTDGTQSAPLYLSDSTTANHNSVMDTLDYNIYYSPNSSEHYMKSGGSTYWNFAQLHDCTTITGCTDWETNGLSGDPKYTSSTNYVLQSDSPAIDNGDVLNGTFTTDFTGATRGDTWGIGAYEYSPTAQLQGIQITGGTIQ